jgi:hypothetical protein
VWESIKLRRNIKHKFLEYDSVCCQAFTVGADHVSRQSSGYRHCRWPQKFLRKALLLSSWWRAYSLQSITTIGAFHPPYYFRVSTYPQPHLHTSTGPHITPRIKCCGLNKSGGRDSSVGIETRYGLDVSEFETRLGTWFSTPVRAGPGANTASRTVDTGFSPGVRRPERGVDHAPPYNAEVKNEWS